MPGSPDATLLRGLPVAWRPSPAYRERSRLRRFLEGLGFADYDAFLAWSQAEPAAFWEAVVRDLDLQFHRPYEAVLDASGGLPWTRWFPGGGYNYVHNALAKWADGPERDRTALVWEGDDGAVREWSFGGLAAEAARFAGGLRSLGIGPGDRIGIFMPMTPETAAATLAAGAVGATYVPIFSGYGAEAVAQRLRDCGARLLVTADGFLRRGREVAMKETADAAFRAAPDVERVVVFRRLGRADLPWDDSRDVAWEDLTAGQAADLRLEDTESEHPCLLIYTSGTTGRPKGALHPHCGFPVKATQDMAHLFDVQSGDRLFWFTDLGWMMGPWAIMGALTLGAACVLYEGAPDFPDPGRVWGMVARHRVTHLGISPTAVRALMIHGDEWPARHDLSSLVVLGSTGEPWNPTAWEWYFRCAGGGRLPIVNYSGGTEISGGILGCVTLRPIRPCGFNTAVPGIAAEVLNDAGQPVRGEVGELVIRNAWPGMTRGFWQDRERYLETYWARWPDTWVHGDWAIREEDDTWFILGRSDDTIKVAGKRVGPAEVEAAAAAHPGVREAAAIGVPDELKGEAVVVFVVPRDPDAAGEALRSEVEAAIVAALGKTLRPRAVRFVTDLPKTRNAKVLRRLIRAAHLGSDPGDTASLENPAALEAIRSAW